MARSRGLFIFPSAHVSGDQYMQCLKHNVVSISDIIGHSDLFITKTGDSNLPKDQKNTVSGTSITE